MRHQLLKGILVGAAVAIVVTAAGTAFAGTGLGAVFNLGRTNTVSRVSTLTGSTSGKMLQVTNTGTGSALGLTTSPGAAPLRVNSPVVVGNLNADMLDGQHAATLNADSVDGLHAQQLVQGQGSVLTSRVTFRIDEASGLILDVPGLGQFVHGFDGLHGMIVFGSGIGPCDYFDSNGRNVTIRGFGEYQVIFLATGDNDSGFASVLVTSPTHTGTFDVAYLAASGYCTVMVQGILY